jgi:hypothetical protein
LRLLGWWREASHGTVPLRAVWGFSIKSFGCTSATRCTGMLHCVQHDTKTIGVARIHLLRNRSNHSYHAPHFPKRAVTEEEG